MKKIKPSTLIRLISLLIALANQIFAIAAKDSVVFANSPVYQIISIILTIIVVVVCFWYNNDFTKTARLAGMVLNALKDGKLSYEEVEKLIEFAESNKDNDEEKKYESRESEKGE